MRHSSFLVQSAGMALLLCALMSPSTALAASGTYVRASLGFDWSGNAGFSDSNCAQTRPPALFGCQSGNDGRSIGARGDFGDGGLADLGIGHYFLPWLRGELRLSYRPNLGFAGNANFLGVSGRQPVGADLDSTAGFAVAYADLPALGAWRPFIGVGAGVARNHLGSVTYNFPGLSRNAVTYTPSGTETGFAWLISAGFSLPLSDRLGLDIAYQYTDLGEVHTRAGPATIVRASGRRAIEIGSTQAKLNTQGVMVSVRYRF